MVVVFGVCGRRTASAGLWLSLEFGAFVVSVVQVHTTYNIVESSSVCNFASDFTQAFNEQMVQNTSDCFNFVEAQDKTKFQEALKDLESLSDELVINNLWQNMSNLLTAVQTCFRTFRPTPRDTSLCPLSWRRRLTQRSWMAPIDLVESIANITSRQLIEYR